MVKKVIQKNKQSVNVNVHLHHKKSKPKSSTPASKRKGVSSLPIPQSYYNPVFVSSQPYPNFPSPGTEPAIRATNQVYNPLTNPVMTSPTRIATEIKNEKSDYEEARLHRERLSQIRQKGNDFQEMQELNNMYNNFTTNPLIHQPDLAPTDLAEQTRYNLRGQRSMKNYYSPSPFQKK
jgi:hypothetical protein